MSAPVDVAILGGGLAGLTLAAQLKLRAPQLSVVVLEREAWPVRESAHKVGESTVEIGARYLHRSVGMGDTLDAQHLPKLGLRFFFSAGDNRDIAARPEVGLRDFMPVRTWQLDRGRLENQLAELCAARGVELMPGARVCDVEVGEPHVVRWTGVGAGELRARWVVDGTGRRGALRRSLDVNRRSGLQVNASWFRLERSLDIDAWSDQPEYRGWPQQPRRLSTNHLMGDGWWLWLIPLASGSTSVGLVSHADRHPLSDTRSYAKLLDWMDQHEPQAAEHVRAAGVPQDFHCLGGLAKDARAVISPKRWALIGDAGRFLDPFYSPGTDFVGMTNLLVGRAIRADLAGEANAEKVVSDADRWLRVTYRGFVPTYRRLYELLGRPGPMCAKLLWDFAFYWSVFGRIFAGAETDPLETLDRVEPLIRGGLSLHIEMQALLTEWGRLAAPELPGMHRIDYGSLPDWRALNRKLLTPGALEDDLVANLSFMHEVAAEIAAHARTRYPAIPAPTLSLPRPSTPRLEGILP